jgi:hypothetical protein
MIGLLILVLIAAILMYCAARFLPSPINWIAVLVILILAAVAVFGGAVEVD